MDIEIIQRRTVCPHCNTVMQRGTEAVRVHGAGPYHKWCGDVVEWRDMTPEQVREKVANE